MASPTNTDLAAARRPSRAAAAGSAPAPVPHRFTLRVPVSDVSVTDWWAAQDDASASVRALIREEIMRHGYTDTVTRPVHQLPRRGRPPAGERDDDDDSHGQVERETSAQAPTSAPVQTTQVEPVSEPPTRTTSPVQAAGRTAQAAPETAAAARIETPASPEQSSSAVSEPAPTGGQIDMNDLFGHGG